METSNQIERSILIRAPQAHVWRALTDTGEFGTWFRVELEGTFGVGKRITGKMTYPGHEGAPFVAVVQRMEPNRLFSFRWPMGAEPGAAGADSLNTLVEFRLEDAPGGTLLTVVESGFDQLPAARRVEAFRGNSEGWSAQVENIRRHVEV